MFSYFVVFWSEFRRFVRIFVNVYILCPILGPPSKILPCVASFSSTSPLRLIGRTRQPEQCPELLYSIELAVPRS